MNIPKCQGDEPSFEAIYDEIRRVFDGVRDQIDKLDAKTGLLLGASGIVLAVLFQGGFFVEEGRQWTNLLLGVAAGAISLGSICALRALWPRTYTEVPDPLKLTEEHIAKAESVTRSVILGNMVKYYYSNEGVAKTKSCWIKLAGALLVLGIVLVAITFIYNLA